jgi:hypothetical protein
MDYLPLAAFGAGLLLQAGTLIAVLVKRRNDREALLRLGREYAALSVRVARAKGGDIREQHITAEGTFKLADTTADGKRDFSDALMKSLLDEAFAQSAQSNP